ncbi:MAG: response regulator [Verrucomicrobiota bacterium]
MDDKIKYQREPLVSVVDDDDLMRSSTRRLLRSVGLRAEGFASAEEFLASKLAGETNCLVLDLRMPGMNCLQLQQRLAENSNPIPIIFVTAQASTAAKHQALEAGAVQFLQKPTDNEVLLLAIYRALNKL